MGGVVSEAVSDGSGVSVASVGLAVSVAAEESEASGSVAVESESPPQAASERTSGSSSATSVPRAFMARVYA